MPQNKLEVSWSELRVGQKYRGGVISIEKFGVFVDIGAECPGFIHVAELTSDCVSDPSSAVRIGDEVEAKVVGIDRPRKHIDLSIRALEVEHSQEDDTSK